nr:MAG TPA: hypothetical protein [Caudoviricetes sp.]
MRSSAFRHTSRRGRRRCGIAPRLCRCARRRPQ